MSTETKGGFVRIMAAIYTGPLTPREWIKEYQPRLEAKIRGRAMGNEGATGFRMIVCEDLKFGGGYVIFSITTYQTEADRDAAANAEGASDFRFSELAAVGCMPLPVGRAIIALATDLELTSVLE